jgi:hypothetical protein
MHTTTTDEPWTHCPASCDPGTGFGDRFFRVDESFRADTRAGLTRARSLNTKYMVYSERNAVTHLPGLFPSDRAQHALKPLA